MGILDRFRRQRDDDPELTRRNLLMSKGRLTDGTVIANTSEDGREMVRFQYSVQGVEFECCEFLTADQVMRPQDYSPGATIGVRYDPQKHSNSIVV